MSIETRTSRLVKKTGVEKSRWTVPLKSLNGWCHGHDLIGDFDLKIKVRERDK